MRAILTIILLVSFTFLKAQPLAQKIPFPWTLETTSFKKSDWEHFLGEDRDYIYLGLLIPRGKESQQVLMTGLTLWLGKKAEHKKSMGFRFPLGLPTSEIPHTTQKLQSVLFNWDEKADRIVKTFQQMEIINSNGKGDTLIGPANRIGGYRTTFTKVGDYWVYELIIPKEGLPDYLENNQKIKLNLRSGALGRPKDLRGTDAVGFVNSRLYRMGSGGKKERDRLNNLFYYSDYTQEVKLKLKKIELDL